MKIENKLGNAASEIEVKPYSPLYANEICDLFHSTIHAIDTDIYSKAEQEAWCPTPPDYQMWLKRLDNTQPWMAIFGSRLAGFIELKDDGYIDCFYVHPDFQKRGIARKLYDHVLNLAHQKKLSQLSVDASKVAMPIFKKWGFKIKRANKISRKNQILINYHMYKPL
ncbi:GNAT family N-acetyltransferase [Snodgrassella alvi]|uniref:GNAT family N-acetyltransferase n=1 Tax=Snodgrassella alvi TaxID=1196083 RepID=UPI001179A02B|nr:GNAT family N-acetyltransferase [Snodgrassella alvi]